MKKINCIILVLLAVAAGCKKTNYLMYNDGARIQIADTTIQSFTFIYEAPTVTRDTVYVRLNTIGGVTDQNRTFTVQQIQEIDHYNFTKDPATGKTIDSTPVFMQYQAVPGTHYVPFTDPGAQAFQFVQADSPSTQLPIILLRDTSLRSNSYRLRIRIVANDEFALGEKTFLEKTLVFSDKLERFYSWRVDNSSALAYGSFGKYSTGKHQFMIDVLQTRIDEAWYQAIAAVGAQTHYNTLLKEALAAFNADPANIASGRAPVREGNSTSAPISFP